MDPLIDKPVSNQDLSLSSPSLCLVCCSKFDLNVTQFMCNDNHTNLIDKNIAIIFLLRKLLIVPDHQLKRNLKECGNPEDWGINLCVECTLLIRQARDLHGLLLKIGGKLKDVQRIIVNKTKKSKVVNKQLVNFSGNSQKKNEIWRRTREFVKNNNYTDQFLNPFTEGDKLAKAKSLGRKIQQPPPPPPPTPVNLTSLKTEEVPSPQIEVVLERDEEEDDDEVPFNTFEDDDMDWEEEEDDPLEFDEVEIGETKSTRSTGENKKVTTTSTAAKKVKRVQKPNIIVDGKYKCRYCEEDTFFDKRKSCLYHESKHLKGIPLTTRPYQKRIFIDGKWKCRHCDHLFNTIKGLHVHEKDKHVEVKGQFVCDLCGKPFNSKIYLQSHNYQQHGLLADGKPVMKKEKKVEPFVCNICGGTLWSQRGMQNHLQVVHGGLFRFECEICGRKIPTSTALKKHMLSKHREEEVTERMVREEGLRLWGCEVRGCARKFMGKGSLDKHVEKVHGGIGGKGEGEVGRGRFECDECGRGFWERHKLKRHQLIHKKK